MEKEQKKVLSYRQRKLEFAKNNEDILHFLEGSRPQRLNVIRAVMGYFNKRTAREKISAIKLFFAVISFSSRAGYNVAIQPKNIKSLELLAKLVDDVNHTLNESRSRVKRLRMEMKPLVAWLKVAKKRREELEAESHGI